MQLLNFARSLFFMVILVMLLLGVLPLLARADAAPAGSVGKAIGYVVSAQGDAVAKTPDGSERPLLCGTPVHEGELLKTYGGAQIGILAGEVLAKLGEESQVEVARTPEGTPHFALLAGQVRLIDTRSSAETPLQLTTPHALSFVRGGDVEASLVELPDHVPYSLVCGWRAAFEIQRRGGEEKNLAEPGQCAMVRAMGAIQHVAARAGSFEEAMVTCPLLAVGAFFSPSDVAANSIPAGQAPPGGFDAKLLPPCFTATCGGDPIHPNPDPQPDPQPDPRPKVSVTVIEGPATPIVLE